jgi:hypothetical protein
MIFAGYFWFNRGQKSPIFTLKIIASVRISPEILSMTTKNPAKIRFFASERWKELPIKKGATLKRYAISNHGRIASFTGRIDEGSILKTRLTQRYPSITIKISGKNINYYIHRLVATHFCTKATPRHNFVIHLDHKKENNKAGNLKWVKHAVQIEHAKKDPAFVAQLRPLEGKKLNADKVKIIKGKIREGKIRMKDLARKFKISEMQLYRIKSGENWSHVKG